MTSDDSSDEKRSSHDNRNNYTWFVSFTAAMMPFLGFLYSHQKGVTVKILERLAKTNNGMYAIIALPFLTLGMEKSVYDTVQSIQGINPNEIPEDRGGFPSGGANLPSFSFVPVQKTNLVEDFINKNILGQNQLVKKFTQNRPTDKKKEDTS